MEQLKGTLNSVGTLNGTISGVGALIGGLNIATGGGSAPPFTGEYEYTPTEETQTIPINGKRATQNITINPIPNNYGLITWDGTTITVS